MGFVLVSHAQQEPLEVRDPEFQFEFEDYLDPRASRFRTAFSLASGSHQPFVETRWDPSRQLLTVRPLDPLRPTLRYTLELDPDALVGLGGRRIEGAELWEFVVEPDAERSPDAPAVALTYSDDVAPLLWEHCGCHWEPESQLGRLDFDSLRDAPVQRPGRRNLLPYDAANSYLLEKVLIDYPNRFGTQMPPPWSDEARLSRDEVRVIHDWIAAGAAR